MTVTAVGRRLSDQDLDKIAATVAARIETLLDRLESTSTAPAPETTVASATHARPGATQPR